MAKNPLAEILTRWLRDPATPRDSIEIDVTHRGADNDLRTVSGVDVAGASAGGVELEDGTPLPWHRVREARVGGAVVWQRRATRDDA